MKKKNNIVQATTEIFELSCIRNLEDKQHNEFAEKIESLIECFEILDADIDNKNYYRSTPLISIERIIVFKDVLFKYLREGCRRKELLKYSFSLAEKYMNEQN